MLFFLFIMYLTHTSSTQTFLKPLKSVLNLCVSGSWNTNDSELAKTRINFEHHKRSSCGREWLERFAVDVLSAIDSKETKMLQSGLRDVRSFASIVTKEILTLFISEDFVFQILCILKILLRQEGSVSGHKFIMSENVADESQLHYFSWAQSHFSQNTWKKQINLSKTSDPICNCLYKCHSFWDDLQTGWLI